MENVVKNFENKERMDYDINKMATTWFWGLAPLRRMTDLRDEVDSLF